MASIEAQEEAIAAASQIFNSPGGIVDKVNGIKTGGYTAQTTDLVKETSLN